MLSVCRKSVVRQINCVGGITCGPRASSKFLPARASEQGNVIGLVSMSSKKIVIDLTRDLIYLKFVAKDFSPKIISPSASENFGDSA